MTDTKTRHHRSSEAGQFIHGDAMYTLRTNIRHVVDEVEEINKCKEEMEKEMKKHAEEIKQHANEMKTLMIEMKKRQDRLNITVDRLKLWIAPPVK